MLTHPVHKCCITIGVCHKRADGDHRICEQIEEGVANRNQKEQGNTRHIDDKGHRQHLLFVAFIEERNGKQKNNQTYDAIDEGRYRDVLVTELHFITQKQYRKKSKRDDKVRKNKKYGKQHLVFVTKNTDERTTGILDAVRNG